MKEISARCFTSIKYTVFENILGDVSPENDIFKPKKKGCLLEFVTPNFEISLKFQLVK